MNPEKTIEAYIHEAIRTACHWAWDQYRKVFPVKKTLFVLSNPKFGSILNYAETSNVNERPLQIKDMSKIYAFTRFPRLFIFLSWGTLQSHPRYGGFFK